METIADALVEAVMFIALRGYGELEGAEELEASDVQALEDIAGILSAASPEEQQAISEAVERALAQLPPESEAAAYYRAWMENMFGDDSEE
ncbi:MAG: hypothetical protein SFU56_11945 [Capsulimonadales bacterium]|nr:hypothetical protein [Capsulimonadales bacterium]